MPYLTSEAIEGRIWAGSLHLYNCGYLIGEWFDIDQDTDPSDLESDIKSYIKANLPAGESYAESVEELHCFDQEVPALDGECSPLDAIEHLVELAEKVENCPFDYETYIALTDAGIEVDENTSAYDCGDTHHESHAWAQLADEIGDWHEAGTFADYVDWEQFYNGSFTLYRINDSYMAISEG